MTRKYDDASPSSDQARIVVRSSVLSRGKQILENIKIATLTELFNILVNRYGYHLEATWELPVNTQNQNPDATSHELEIRSEQ